MVYSGYPATVKRQKRPDPFRRRLPVVVRQQGGCRAGDEGTAKAPGEIRTVPAPGENQPC